MNLYSFVHNDPLTHFDEYGLLDFGQYEPQYLRHKSQFDQTVKSVVSKASHGLYDYLGLGLIRSDRTLPGYHESSVYKDHAWIDRQFGTHFTARRELENALGFQYTVGVFPPPSISFLETAGKTASATRGLVAQGLRVSSIQAAKSQTTLNQAQKSYKFSGPQWRFPEKPDNLMPELQRDFKSRIYTSDFLRIKPEKHALKDGEVFCPRHHGPHYHVEVRIDPSKSWNNKGNTYYLKPPTYEMGQGTGFLPGELFPGIE